MNTVTRWNPFLEFDDFFRAGLNPATLTSAARVPATPRDQAPWLPAVDIVETDVDFRLLLEIPAVAAQDVKVAVEDNVLTVSGERRVVGLDTASEQVSDELGETANTDAGSSVTHHRRERRFGRFSRSFRLPETVDEEAIEATTKDGVLTLTIAKRAQPQPRQIEVKVH
jgi:HSP20 family protein